jgi:hypothetical protein
MKLRKEIDTKVKKMKQDEAADDEIMHEVALMAYKALFAPPKRNRRNKPNHSSFSGGNNNNGSD